MEKDALSVGKKDRQKDPKVTAHQLSSALRLELNINTDTTPSSIHERCEICFLPRILKISGREKKTSFANNLRRSRPITLSKLNLGLSLYCSYSLRWGGNGILLG